MTDAAPDYRRQKQIALTTLIGASLVLGIVDAALQLQTARAALTLHRQPRDAASSAFAGCSSIRAELDIRRPLWLNVGIVMAAAIFVPYYLYKTRPAGKRVPAIAGFFGLVLACAFASAIGAIADGVFLRHAPPQPADAMARADFYLIDKPRFRDDPLLLVCELVKRRTRPSSRR